MSSARTPARHDQLVTLTTALASPSDCPIDTGVRVSVQSPEGWAQLGLGGIDQLPLPGEAFHCMLFGSRTFGRIK